VSDHEKISHWKKKPPPGDSITVIVFQGPKCAKVTVRRGRRNGQQLGRRMMLYSTREEPSSSTNEPLLSGVVGTVRLDDRNVRWAWGWTTPEANALRVLAALT
jgi:hypothetical protein